MPHGERAGLRRDFQRSLYGPGQAADSNGNHAARRVAFNRAPQRAGFRARDFQRSGGVQVRGLAQLESSVYATSETALKRGERFFFAHMDFENRGQASDLEKLHNLLRRPDQLDLGA